MPASQNPTGALTSGVFAPDSLGNQVGYGKSNYLFQSGMVTPIVSSQIARKLEQYDVPYMLEQLGRAQSITGPTWNWYEMGRLRQGGRITNVSGSGTTRVVTTNIAVSANTAGYITQGRTIFTDYTIPLNVLSVNNAGATQVLTVELQDKINDTFTLALGSTTVDTTNYVGFGDLASTDVEGGTGLGGRVFIPTEFTNNLNLLKQQRKITRHALKAKLYISDTDKRYYYDGDEAILKTLNSDAEHAIMWHKKSNVQLGEKMTGDGIFTTVNAGGTKLLYSNFLLESDLQVWVDKLKKANPGSKEFMVLAGVDAMSDVMRTLRPYVLNGGITYGSLVGTMQSKGNLVGLDITQYKFNGVILNFMTYNPFNDTATLPFTGLGTSANLKINFSSMLLALNLGSDSGGTPLISLKHMADSLLITTIIEGTVGIDGMPAKNSANSFDGVEVDFIKEIGAETRFAPAHGIMYRQD